MELVIADENNTDLLVTEDYELDCSFGDDENELELTLPPGVAPPAKGYAYIDGTEYGGTIDSTKASTTRGGSRVITCNGRSWQGFLAAKRLVPDTVNSHITVNGSFHEVVTQLLTRCTLTDIFKADPSSTQNIASYSFDRFIDLYNGMRKMCAANGLKLCLQRRDGYIWVSAKPSEVIGDQIDNDLLDFDITQNHRVLNHLVCAGEGEGTERAVLHLFADREGNVSETQSLFDLDEIAGLYEYNSAELDKLKEDGTKKLKDYQSTGAVEVETHDDISIDVGDVVIARDNATNMLISAEVVKKIVKVESGVLSYQYEVGQSASYASTTYDGSASGGGGGGGHAYFAGDGLKLENYTFSADVTLDKLSGVEQKADDALSAASDAEAAAAASASSATEAQTAANAAQTEATSAATAATAATTQAEDAQAAAANALAKAEAAIIKAADAKAIAGEAKQIAQDAATGSFLAAHPVGSIFYTTKHTNPGTVYGGTWKEVDCLGGYAYERTQ